MPPTQIANYARFYSPGITKFYWMVTSANYAAPSRAELDASIDLTRQVRDVKGWGSKRDTVDSADYGSDFKKTIGGRTSVDDSSLSLHAAQSGTDARQLMPQDATGNIVVCWGGDVAGRKMDVFPVQVLTAGKEVADNAPFGMTFEYSITDRPALDVTIPA